MDGPLRSLSGALRRDSDLQARVQRFHGAIDGLPGLAELECAIFVPSPWLRELVIISGECVPPRLSSIVYQYTSWPPGATAGARDNWIF